MEVLFKLQKETKGALRYQEVDEKGEPIESPWAHALHAATRDRRSGRNEIDGYAIELRTAHTGGAGAARECRHEC
jgi:hypothetical protein